MKVARITLHAALCALILVGFASTKVTAAGTSSKSGSGSSNSSSSSSSSSSQSQSSATGVQTYTSSSPLQIGTIVQLSSGGTANSVEPATFAKMQQMYGTVIDPNNLPITVTDTSVKNETYVATSGRYAVLVDTQNGPIKEGDYVTMSAVDGVAMKAGTYDEQQYVFGRAAADFDGKTNVIDSTSLKKSNGSDYKTVQIGVIPVSITIQRNPNQKSTKVNLPPFLQEAGQAIAQKPIGPGRLYMALLITGLCVCVALVTLYAGIRNAVIAIGRNPLSKKSIFRGLLEIILTSFLILIIGLFAVYLLLKL